MGLVSAVQPFQIIHQPTIKLKANNNVKNCNSVSSSSDVLVNNCSEQYDYKGSSSSMSLGERILALSVSQIKSKRTKFFEDCKPFLEILGWKNFLLQGGKVAILLLSTMSLEWNNYLDDALRREQEGERNIPPFEPDIPMYLNMFKQTFLSFWSTSVIRRFYEYIARVNGSLIADKLTKDIGKSFERKLMRWPYRTASYKIFFTACRAHTLDIFSSMTFEALRNIFTAPKEKVNSKEILLWIRNKVIIACTAVPLFSIGYSLGSLVHQKHGGNLCSIAFEAIGLQILVYAGIQ